LRQNKLSPKQIWFIGISDPYEEPLNPKLLIESDKEPLKESVTRVIAKVKELGYINYSAGCIKKQRPTLGWQ